MATEAAMVHTGFPYTGDEDTFGEQGTVHIRGPNEGPVCDRAEPRRRSSYGVPAGQSHQPGIGYNVLDVVPPAQHTVRDWSNPDRLVNYAVGDINSTERGSGARANAGKTRLDLVPLHLLTSGADVLEYGAGKYAEWNWAKGMNWSIPYACMLRHLSAWYSGEDMDPESGKPHLGHVMANLLMLEHYAKAYPEGDDRPSRWFGGTDEVPF